MKPIRITLQAKPGHAPMPDWEAFEVPDTGGTLAVHHPAREGAVTIPDRWAVTHIPSGLALPAPYFGWDSIEIALAYAKAFYDEARQRGADMHKVEPLDGLSSDARQALRNVFERDLRPVELPA